MKIDRRQFTLGMAGAAGLIGMGPLGRAFAARDSEMNILCWEGYNSDEVLGPFRSANAGASVRAESGTSDPDMINKLRAGEVNVWDLINLNQPWARDQLYPENLIKPLDKDRFLPYFEKMLPDFAAPYPLSFADDGNLLGMPQRFGPFSFVVNTDKISRATLWAGVALLVAVLPLPWFVRALAGGGIYLALIWLAGIVDPDDRRMVTSLFR